MDPVVEHLAWMRLRGLRAPTLRQRQRVLVMVQREVGPLLEADRRALAAWQRTHTHLAPESMCAYVSNVQGFYRWAVDEELIETDPSTRLVRPKIPRGIPKPISEEKLSVAIVRADPLMRGVLLTAAYAGLRAAEIAALRWEDVQLDADPPILVVRDGKGGKDRVVPVAPVLVTYLRQRGPREAGPVFGSRTDPDAHVNAKWFAERATNYLHSLGYPDTLHKVRHRFATRLYATTLDLRLTQEMLGHASPMTTARYAAYSPTRAAEAIARMGAA